ncbi:MAG: hypothetical protein J0L72_11965 [Armatimonadetes bacterium]|nr:hypothetical protein [Armatimonadota bacterium]
MGQGGSSREAWKAMVLRSMPPPAWLSAPGPNSDVAISTRVRLARNLVGHRFPNHAGADELREIGRKVREVAEKIPLEVIRRITEAEREYLIGCRMISPDYKTEEPGRMLLANTPRSISIMVNEEDHLRLQSLHAGWDLMQCHEEMDQLMTEFEKGLQFAKSDEHGYLTSSPYNMGSGIRISAMFHLVALAHTKKINSVLKALTNSGLTARGLYGETSRAIGAFFQVSSIKPDLARFRGACEYLLEEERKARQSCDDKELSALAHEAVRFAVTSKELSQVDAFRVLAWVRWLATRGRPDLQLSVQDIDRLLSTLEVRAVDENASAAKDRAVTLRNRLEHLLGFSQ